MWSIWRRGVRSDLLSTPDTPNRRQRVFIARLFLFVHLAYGDDADHFGAMVIFTLGMGNPHYEPDTDMGYPFGQW